MKNPILYIFSVLLFMQSGDLFSQTVVIPDPNFRQFLVSEYPSAMNANQELIPDSATFVTGLFDCSGLKIANLEGVQYFTGIRYLFCFKNNLSTLPDLSAITNLVELHAYQNKISSLPSFNNLKKLKVLDLGDNKLINLPEIDSLDNLRDLFVYRNELSLIPDMVHLAGLQSFHCYGNKVTSIGPMPSGLRDFVFYKNSLTEFPDISLAKGLIFLDGHMNYLSDIPDLSSYTSLRNCNLHNNRLTFEDLIPASAYSDSIKWKLMPQNLVPVSEEFTATKNQPFIIDINVDSEISGLTYSWYKDGTLLSQTTKPELEIPSHESDSGTYYCMITTSDSVFSSLTLTTETFTVEVRPDFIEEEELTLTPNGDGKNDEFYFEEQGQLNVYDSNGTLVDQQTSPLFWNGSTRSGTELGTGFYFIRINNSVYSITIIR